MTVFLTSHTGGWESVDGRKIPGMLNSENNFLGNLKSRWTENSNILFIAADPADHAKNDFISMAFQYAFPKSGLSVSGVTVWDDRNEQAIDRLGAYDVLILSGGHVPTQNHFFEKIGLKDKLRGYKGVIIGISAGTMNCAETVYAHPECEGEALDPNYQRLIPGLGLTKLMILPHYQVIKNDILDGMRVFEDIAYPDSKGREFYALTDGSYVISENGTEMLYGEAFLIKDGKLKKICEHGNTCKLGNDVIWSFQREGLTD